MRLACVLVLFGVLASCAHVRGPSASFGGVSAKASDYVELGDIDALSAMVVAEEFKVKAKAGHKRITIRISSDGGSVFAGLDMIKDIVDAKEAYGVKTVCLVDNRAYSMAMVVLQSAACDVRAMKPYATLMIHHASVKTQGTADDLDDTSLILKAIDRAMLTIVANRMKMPIDELYKRIDRRDWWMAGEEALKVRAVDVIAE